MTTNQTAPTEAELAQIRARIAELEMMERQRPLLPVVAAILELGRAWLDAHERPPWIEGDV